ncbi:hypothetical protein [Streptomyces sp. NPDC002133]|uniref:hypothetical protein n=1 Tax=Streptomyces sp. NPDC002133 TaxID=3154409 RepID=UPI003325DE7B
MRSHTVLTPRTMSTGLVVVALTATIAALVFPLRSYADRSGTGTADLEAGSVPVRAPVRPSPGPSVRPFPVPPSVRILTFRWRPDGDLA